MVHVHVVHVHVANVVHVHVVHVCMQYMRMWYIGMCNGWLDEHLYWLVVPWACVGTRRQVLFDTRL